MSGLVNMFIDFENGFQLDLSGEPWLSQGVRCSIAGSSGSGKSYLSIVMAEELIRLGIPLMAIDPVGEYRSLGYLNNLNGKYKHTRIVTVASDGDIRLVLDQTGWIQAAVEALDSSDGVVVDLSDLEEPDQYVAYNALLSHLWNVKHAQWKVGQARSMFLFVEEAHIFAPQKFLTDMPSLRMTIRVARQGRKHGINTVFVSQRAGDLEKDIVGQSNLLFVGYTRLEHDFKAVKTLLGAGDTGIGKLTEKYVPPGWTGYRPVQGRITHADLLALKTGEFYAVYGHKKYWLPRTRERFTPDMAATPPIMQRRLFDMDQFNSGQGQNEQHQNGHVQKKEYYASD